MSLLETIQKDSFAAAKAGKSVESDILKIALSSLKNAQISKGASDELSEEEEVKIVFGESKKIRDSIEQYEGGGRQDLADREKEQLAVIERYLPKQADESEVRSVVSAIIEETGATGIASMGMVMGNTMKKLQGKADGKLVSDIVKEMLSQ